MSEIVTAGILVIGDEILSGRTKDKNIGFIAEYLTNIGIDLKEVRVVADEESDIVDALNALRNRYTYVFTTGGIGPTHDDITADSVAKAFGVGIDHHPEVVARFRERWRKAQRCEGRGEGDAGEHAEVENTGLIDSEAGNAGENTDRLLWRVFVTGREKSTPPPEKAFPVSGEQFHRDCRALTLRLN